MYLDSFHSFIAKYKDYCFYQPVIFKRNIIEIQGKWHDQTIILSEKIFSKICKKTVIDIGCNVGFFLHQAIRFGASKAVGWDSDPKVVEIATELKSVLNMDRSIDIYQKDISTDFITDRYDVCLILNLPVFLIQKAVDIAVDKCMKIYVQHPVDYCIDTKYVITCMPCDRAYGHTLISEINVLAN